MQLRRWIAGVGTAAAVAGGILYGFKPKPVPVDLAQALRGPLKVTVEEEGRTRVKDRFVISAPVAGFMKRVTIDVGDLVRAGQTLVELEPLRSDLLDPRRRASAEAGVSSAEASLRAEEEKMRAVRADAEYGEKNLERNRKLFGAGVFSKDAVEQAEAAANRSAANLLASEAAVKVARFELDRARAILHISAADSVAVAGKLVAIKAPVRGRVLKIHRESEGAVQQGEPLFEIGDPLKLEVRVEALSTDAIRIGPGTPVLFERWGGESALRGTVRVVEPAGFTKISSLGVEEQRVLVIIEITPGDRTALRLGDGYRLEASFTLWEGTDVLQVPASSLFRKRDGWAVFVVESGRALKRDVKVGHRTGLSAEILSGLAEGESVISHPDNSIGEGTRVRAQRP